MSFASTAESAAKWPCTMLDTGAEAPQGAGKPTASLLESRASRNGAGNTEKSPGRICLGELGYPKINGVPKYFLWDIPHLWTNPNLNNSGGPCCEAILQTMVLLFSALDCGWWLVLLITCALHMLIAAVHHGSCGDAATGPSKASTSAPTCFPHGSLDANTMRPLGCPNGCLFGDAKYKLYGGFLSHGGTPVIIQN